MSKERKKIRYAFTEYVLKNNLTGERLEGTILCPRRFEEEIGQYIPDDIQLLIRAERKHSVTHPNFFNGFVEFENVSYTNIPVAYCLLNNLN